MRLIILRDIDNNFSNFSITNSINSKLKERDDWKSLSVAVKLKIFDRMTSDDFMNKKKKSTADVEKTPKPSQSNVHIDKKVKLSGSGPKYQ